jgi:hypothetical protein
LVGIKTLVNPAMDSTSHVIDVYHPIMSSTTGGDANNDSRPTRANANATPFKFIVYMHGFFGGGILNPVSYFELLDAVTSFGCGILVLQCVRDPRFFPGTCGRVVVSPRFSLVDVGV